MDPSAARRQEARTSALALDLLREVVLEPDLGHERELRLEPVGVLLLVPEDVLEQLGRAVVARPPAELDARVEDLDVGLLGLEIQAELLRDRLADGDLAQPLELTPNGVRAHLAALEREGLVQVEGRRPGVRKPALVHTRGAGWTVCNFDLAHL